MVVQRLDKCVITFRKRRNLHCSQNHEATALQEVINKAQSQKPTKSLIIIQTSEKSDTGLAKVIFDLTD